MRPSKHALDAGALKTMAGYAAMILLAAAAFMAIRHAGADLVAPEPAGDVRFGAAASGAQGHALLHVLLALVAVIIASRALGRLFKLFHQPAVIGEVLAGILLGPSLLGRLSPAASAYLLPTSVAPFLQVIAQVGVILFMFLVGLELDTGLLRKKTHSTLAISHASILAPFVLGSLLALWIYPKLSTRDVPFGVFAMFMGVSMSVTAFPVLARILTDRGIHKTRLGVIAISCAAVDDVSAWCLLAIVAGVAQAQAGRAAVTIGLSVAYIGFMFAVVRPVVKRVVRRQELTQRLGQNGAAVVFVGLLLSALATEFIGIHAIFGAFLLGAVIPHDSRLSRDLTTKLEDLVVVLLLPAFFAFTGMRTQIGLVAGAENWAICGLVIAVACVGKFGGSAVAARLSGLPWRDSAALGILMNTRGLMELIVLNIGLDLHVISPTLFAMMVIMALVTTFATTPILHLLTRRSDLVDRETAGARS
jgi:Kef-type K+ transport system membrane component KefB